MREYIIEKINKHKNRRRIKKLAKAIELLQKEGLSVVRLKTVGGTQYIEAKSGSYRKVGRR